MSEGLTRRAWLEGAAALAGVALGPARAQAKPRVLGPDFDILQSFSLWRRAAEFEQTPEQAMASRLLARAPKNRGPLGVMLFLESLKATNRNGEAYNAGWSDHANPLILDFFAATSLKPTQGDETSWCAASLNWALQHCGYTGGTDSALSSSFREAPGRTGSPRLGDIVVFRDVAAGQQGAGHVCLFLAQTRDRIYVLGGNQTDIQGHASVCRKWLNVKDSVRELDSFHAIEAFR
jgi:uncharacterized protein (TIGR02594 family)